MDHPIFVEGGIGYGEVILCNKIIHQSIDICELHSIQQLLSEHQGVFRAHAHVTSHHGAKELPHQRAGFLRALLLDGGFQSSDIVDLSTFKFTGHKAMLAHAFSFSHQHIQRGKVFPLACVCRQVGLREAFEHGAGTAVSKAERRVFILSQLLQTGIEHGEKHLLMQVLEKIPHRLVASVFARPGSTDGRI